MGHALREKLSEGYSKNDFRADLLSSLVVTMVAIPLSMALAIASGVPPQYGLYTAIIAGIIVSILGGSRFQVTGPTAAFVVILAPIAAKHGLAGLLTAGLMAGSILWTMGFARTGKLIQFIPYPVITGFTAGIAVVIATLQLKDFFGLTIDRMPENFPDKVIAIFEAFPTIHWPDALIGFSTLAMLIVWPKLNKKIPAPLIALVAVALVAAVIQKNISGFSFSTIGNRFSYMTSEGIGFGIPRSLPKFSLPWLFGDKPFSISFQAVKDLFPSAFAIALLGAIESLLSAVVADGMSQTKHNPDVELRALGIGNIIAPFFGGIAATGAIARTATNIRFGARSPLSATMHGIFILLAILLFAPAIAYLPMASLSALLLIVAYNMSEIKHFLHILRVAPKSDMAVLLICFGLTVLFDMVLGVSIGIVLAALLFMKRMATVTASKSVEFQQKSPALSKDSIPGEVLLYDIHGPLFFGAAENAMQTITTVNNNVRGVFLCMENVPVMDVSGLVALESVVQHLLQAHRKIYFIGMNPQPNALVLKSSIIQSAQQLYICRTIQDAIDHWNAGLIAIS